MQLLALGYQYNVLSKLKLSVQRIEKILSLVNGLLKLDSLTRLLNNSRGEKTKQIPLLQK